MKYVEYAVIAIVGLLAWRFFSRGMSAYASAGPAMASGSAGWVSGPAGSFTGYMGYPYSMPPAYAFAPGSSKQITANYSPDDNSFSFGFGSSNW